MLIYSDGITESLDEADEEFGLERLSGLFEAGSRADLPPATLLQSLRGELRRYNGGRPLTDDQTALVVALHERRVQPRAVGLQLDEGLLEGPQVAHHLQAHTWGRASRQARQR